MIKSRIYERKTEIEERIKNAKAAGGFNHNVTLIAVTKYQPIELANEAIKAGITDIGENHVQSLMERDNLYLPCRRHFIGHLQTNKVKHLLSIKDLSLIQSVDSLRLALEINKYSEKSGKTTNILIQVNIAGEAAKFGLPESEVLETVKNISELQNVKIKGFMSIMPIETKSVYYQKMYNIFCEFQQRNIHNTDIKLLSMGMSGDFEEAVKYGANMVRVGSLLFS